MIRQNPLTLVTPVLETHHPQLQRVLKKIRRELDEGMNLAFEQPGTMHYCRWVLLDEADTDTNPGTDIKAELVFVSNFDGSVEEHINDLANVAGSFIDMIYEHCKEYPSQELRTPETRANYLKKWHIKASAFYIGAPGRNLHQIKKENQLRNFIRDFLNTKNWKEYTASEVHKAIQHAVYAKPEFDWVKEKAQTPNINWPGMALLGLVLLVMLPIVIVWILYIHFALEKKDKNFTLTPSQLKEAHLTQLEEYEDLENQNQFTQIVVMKPGKVRLITFKALMLFARTLISFQFVKGKLMGIPTIHFARWVLFDNDKRVLFFSNFDGSWQQYLGDFVDKSGWGLTGIFSNTTNFPKTNFLFTGGAYDEVHFLAWSRFTQIKTEVWYSAYPHLSIKNVNNNTLIRQSLIKNLNEHQSQLFLKRF